MKISVTRSGVVLLILVVLAQMLIVERSACAAGFKPGSTYVGVRKLTNRDARIIGSPLNHPYTMGLTDDVVANVLSSIHYRDKGMLKITKSKRRAVFSRDEVRVLAPLIADAFTRATAADYVIVYSPAERFLLSKLHTYCMMFITGDELNVAFTAIRQKLSYNVTESDKKRMDRLFTKPVAMKKSSFWDLVPAEGQRLKQGHLNWLIIDWKAVPIHMPVAKGKTAPSDAAYTSELEERVKRLEQMQGGGTEQKDVPTDEDSYIRVDVARDYMPKRPRGYSGTTSGEMEREELRSLDIKEKLKRLRALRDEGLITDDDYRSKKAQLIIKEQKDKSIRERLKELRDMRDEGLISENDYEELKKKLLDKWF